MREQEYSLKHSQVGLPSLASYMIFATFHLKDEILKDKSPLSTFKDLKKLAKDLNSVAVKSKGENVAIIGVDASLWSEWCEENDVPFPKASCSEDIRESHRILKTSPPYHLNGGHFYFHIKCGSDDKRIEILSIIDKAMGPITDKNKNRTVFGNHEREGRIYGRRILHGLIRSVDPVNFSARVIVGDDDTHHKGSCYCLTQRFVHNWDAISRMSEMHIENMIGRDYHGNLIPNTDERNHLKRSRLHDKDGIPIRILTQGQPYGDSPTGNQREEGVFVSAYAKSLESFNVILQSMLGDKHGFILDEHLTVSTSDMGNIWYVPGAEELGLKAEVDRDINVPINAFFEKRSKNGLMFYNTKDFLHQWGKQPGADNEPLSPRIMELAANTFSRWHSRWYQRDEYPTLGHLKHYLPDGKTELKNISIPERKGLAIKLTLGSLITRPLGEKDVTDFKFPDEARRNAIIKEADCFRIGPKEIIVGVVAPFTLGTGVKVVSYLLKEEHLKGYMMALDESSMQGHTVPDYRELTRKGIGKMLDEAKKALKKHGKDEEKRRFYQSVVYSLEGVRQYFHNYASLARQRRDEFAENQVFERKNMEEIANRMDKLADKAPGSFLEAAQLVFSLYSCFHIIGELISIGRLDQVLQPFYEKDDINEEDAQEIIDSFWLKMDEQVLMNRQYFDNFRTYGTCALPYAGGALIPQGDKASQWVMQTTIGGYLPTNDKKPKDGCNDVTRLCLKASRRLPLNSPCLSLRLNPDTPDDIIEEAAMAVLSGGAEPYFLNDDLLGNSLSELGGNITTAEARDFCSDGCWEPISFGRSELALTYIPVTNAMEAALNRGAAYVSAGPTYLRGQSVSYASRPAAKIGSFEEFMKIFYRHYHWIVANGMAGILRNYGNLWQICPSPLLSSMIEGCMESGRDYTNGGAKHHYIQPVICGMPCTIDSLWAIKKMVFSPGTSVTSLDEMLECLMCDWGHNMIEPIQVKTAGENRSNIRAQRFQQLREIALSLPKFGSGNEEVDKFGGIVASKIAETYEKIMSNPKRYVGQEFADIINGIKKKYSLPGRPFSFMVLPSFGTFEDYLGVGLGVGASADGRRKGATLSSNYSPMPSPSDMPPNTGRRNIFEALKGWNHEESGYALRNPGPVDIDIREDFPKDELKKVLKGFAKSELGSNIMSISCANPEALQEAVKFPERYDLLRLRMGGWNEFYITMFPGHQEQHKRRPIFFANKKK